MKTVSVPQKTGEGSVSPTSLGGWIFQFINTPRKTVKGEVKYLDPEACDVVVGDSGK